MLSTAYDLFLDFRREIISLDDVARGLRVF